MRKRFASTYSPPWWRRVESGSFRGLVVWHSQSGSRERWTAVLFFLLCMQAGMHIPPRPHTLELIFLSRWAYSVFISHRHAQRFVSKGFREIFSNWPTIFKTWHGWFEIVFNVASVFAWKSPRKLVARQRKAHHPPFPTVVASCLCGDLCVFSPQSIGHREMDLTSVLGSKTIASSWWKDDGEIFRTTPCS